MAVIIKIGPKANEKKVRLEIDARKSLSGDVMVFDHGDIDIVLSPTQNKVIAFPKDVPSDMVYGAQNRLFAHLKKRGVVIPESIKAGSFFGSFFYHFGTDFEPLFWSICDALFWPIIFERSFSKLVFYGKIDFLDHQKWVPKTTTKKVTKKGPSK